ncbi:MAG: aminotransferase class I/II-fold pyridoxal phosphate-dependent enzyme, partial [Atopostipes suicloacalis]|nr:aminotransferase class I/II-fold pyridoxal phosphate-dependent enzyme [Atopostipes suicloacalis]
MSLPKHGSNPKYLYKKLEIEMPEKIIDFSVNLNPLGPPQILFEQWGSLKEEIIDYPDPFGEKLRNKLSSKEGVDAGNILLANGAAELIQLVAIYLQGKNIALFQPTFSEYKRMTSAYNAQLINVSIDKLKDKEYLKKLAKKQDAIFLCHPNNPTGESYEQSRLEDLLAICEQNKTYLIVDEAFYDFSDEIYSLLAKVKESTYLIILRSATKMFSIAGIRLGYLFAEKKLVKQLRSLQSYWSVNAVALRIGEFIVDEEDFVKETQDYIRKVQQKIFPILKNQGFLL